MPIHGYPGNVITANPTAPTVSSASGVWTTEQQLLAVNQGNWPGYEYPVNNSLRFNSADTAYLNRTPASASNRRTWTWSGWVKRGALGSAQVLMSSDVGTSNTTWIEFGFDAADTFTITAYTTDLNTTSAVFRDPSAWYHVVVAFDSTQATAANRCKIYINGTQQTLTGPGFTLNADYGINNNQIHGIGYRNWASGVGRYFNGYMTEINFVDGQALEPSSFGLNDPETGVWSPKRYTGTYGTNGFYLPMTTEGQWSGAFDGTGDYLTVPASSQFNIGASESFTTECWVYSTFSSNIQTIFNLCDTGSLGYGSARVVIKANQGFQFLAGAGAWSVNIEQGTYTLGSWTHVAFVRNVNTFLCFVNGQQVGTATFSGALVQNRNTLIGANSGTSYNFNGYISNLRVVKGTAVYTANFTPPTSQLTAITNTSLLTLQSSTFIDNSANNFTITSFADSRPQQFSPFADSIDDRSGRGNNWIPNNLDLRTTGAGADIMVDVPTAYGTDTGVGGEVRGNYAVLNPLNKGTNQTIANGNLTNTASGHGTVLSSIGVTSGLWYGEATLTALGAGGIGFTSNQAAESSFTYISGKWWCYDNGVNFYIINQSTLGTGYTIRFSAGQVWQFAIDVTNGNAWIGVNNSWLNSTNGTTGNPATGANPTFTFTAGTLIWPFLENAGPGATWDANFGQRAFAYTAPSGFKALCTTNLPTPTIGATSTTQANDYFDVTTFTGNASTNTIVNSGSMQPDMVWLKSRSNANNHTLYDAVRGVNIQLYPNLTNAEDSGTGLLTSFNSNGFTLGASQNSNDNNGESSVGWQWRAAGSTVSNTAGTITSTVSANTTSGFSVVTWTATNAAATIGHGLGVAPAMIMVKSRADVANWTVYHQAIGNTGGVVLNGTNAVGTNIAWWNNTSPTSSVFSVGSFSNYLTGGHVAYCFAPVAGYSAFGSYTGNGSTDGPFVYLGFRPRFIMFKMTSSTSNWLMIDTQRSQYNQTNEVLLPNSSSAEGTGAGYGAYDILSNGFKPRNSVANETNVNGGTYIYAAFAEAPFKYSRAR